MDIYFKSSVNEHDHDAYRWVRVSRYVNNSREKFRGILKEQSDLVMRFVIDADCIFREILAFNFYERLNQVPCYKVDMGSCIWRADEVREFFSYLDTSALAEVDCSVPSMNSTIPRIVRFVVTQPRNEAEFRRMHEIILSPKSNLRLYWRHAKNDPTAWLWHRHLHNGCPAILRLMVYACASQMKWTRGPRPTRDILERVRYMMTTQHKVWFFGRYIVTWM